jgi:hypothetical protein
VIGAGVGGNAAGPGDRTDQTQPARGFGRDDAGRLEPVEERVNEFVASRASAARRSSPYAAGSPARSAVASGVTRTPPMVSTLNR